jgi:hypothetical protein
MDVFGDKEPCGPDWPEAMAGAVTMHDWAKHG